MIVRTVAVTIKALITYADHTETLEKVRAAQNLAAGPVPVEEAIRQLGAGWVGEEEKFGGIPVRRDRAGKCGYAHKQIPNTNRMIRAERT